MDQRRLREITQEVFDQAEAEYKKDAEAKVLIQEGHQPAVPAAANGVGHMRVYECGFRKMIGVGLWVDGRGFGICLVCFTLVVDWR